MLWIWDPTKSGSNKRDHGFDLQTAARVFDDPLAVTMPDPHPDGGRQRTVGVIGSTTVFVVHTVPEFDPDEDDDVGRIISARKARPRKATPRERKTYEKRH